MFNFLTGAALRAPSHQWGLKMAGITKTQAEAQLATWLAADTAVAAGQSFDVNGKAYTKVNAREIRENLNFWDAKVKELSRGGIIIKGITPC